MSSVTNAPLPLTSSRGAGRSTSSGTSGRRFWLLLAESCDVKGQSGLHQTRGSNGAPAAV